MYNCCTHSFSYLYTNNMFNAYGILYNSNNVILKNSFLILETERLLSSTLKLVKYGMLKINLDQMQCKICIKKSSLPASQGTMGLADSISRVAT